MTEHPDPPKYQHQFNDVISGTPMTITITARPENNSVLFLITNDSGKTVEFVYPSGSHNIVQSTRKDQEGGVGFLPTMLEKLGLNSKSKELVRTHIRDIQSWMYAHPHPATRAITGEEFLNTLKGEERERARVILRREPRFINKNNSQETI